ncbi:MAG: hypothetical protein IT322_08350 [Anaerolineae bacterium]|nr:hypothetical protein [Anaerolineae bacterium]
MINPHVHFDVNQDFMPQVIRLLDDLKITPERWQGEVWLVVLPSLNHITAILLAEMHGRTGARAYSRRCCAPSVPSTNWQKSSTFNGCVKKPAPVAGRCSGCGR